MTVTRPQEETTRQFKSQIADPNLAAYERLKSDEQWFRSKVGLYVAFAHGELIGWNQDRQALLAMIRAQYPEAPRFIARVESDERVEHLPNLVIGDHG